LPPLPLRAAFSGYKVIAIKLFPNNTVASYTIFLEGFLQNQDLPSNSIWGGCPLRDLRRP
jgi:hypothetical protein